VRTAESQAESSLLQARSAFSVLPSPLPFSVLITECLDTKHAACQADAKAEVSEFNAGKLMIRKRIASGEGTLDVGL
jgi:hypothetical protein